MKQVVTIAPNYDTIKPPPRQSRTLYRVQKDLFIAEVYMLSVGQVTEWHIQTWIDYSLGMPDPNTGFGTVWYDMMDRTVRVAKGDYVPTGSGYWLDSVMGYVDLDSASKAHNLNASVCRWWGRTLTFIRGLTRV